MIDCLGRLKENSDIVKIKKVKFSVESVEALLYGFLD
jgi:hypothetical protein